MYVDVYFVSCNVYFDATHRGIHIFTLATAIRSALLVINLSININLGLLLFLLGER